MDAFSAMLGRLGNVMRVASCLCLAGMTLITLMNVIGRLWLRPLFGAEEMVAFLAMLALGFSLPYAHAYRSHIGVEVFVQRLSTRTRRWLKLVREILSITFFAVVMRMLFSYAQDKRIAGEISMNLGLPEHLFIFILAGCFAVTALIMFSDFLLFLRDWRRS